MSEEENVRAKAQNKSTSKSSSKTGADIMAANVDSLRGSDSLRRQCGESSDELDKTLAFLNGLNVHASYGLQLTISTCIRDVDRAGRLLNRVLNEVKA